MLYFKNCLSMSVVILCFKSLIICYRIMVGLFCMYLISFIIHGKLELIWPMFHVINVGMHGGRLCGLCLWWWMCG